MGATQQKGDLGLVKVICSLTEQGVSVSLPISESRKYDLIAEKNNCCKTVQVRFAKKVNGSIPIKLRSVWTNGNGFQERTRDKSDFDVLAVYCPDTGKTYFIDAADFDNSSNLYLRLDDPQKNKLRCRMANNYSTLKW